VGSSFHRQSAAYLKERFVIFKEEETVSNRILREKVERDGTVYVVDLLKQRKLKLFGHICRMKNERRQ